MKTFIAITAVFLAMTASLPAAAQSEDCRRDDTAAQVKACTATIRNLGASKSQKSIAYLYRCQAHDVRGDYSEARIDCLESLRLADDASTWNSLSIVYQNMGRLNDAIDASNSAVSRGGRGIANYYNTRSNAHCKAGNVNASVNDRIEAMNRGKFKPKTVQSLLKNKGYYNGLLDGKFGSGSKTALRAWTRDGCR